MELAILVSSTVNPYLENVVALEILVRIFVVIYCHEKYKQCENESITNNQNSENLHHTIKMV